MRSNLEKPTRFFGPEVSRIVSILHSKIPTNQPVFFYNDMGNYMVAGGFLPTKPWAYNFPWYMEGISGLQEKITSS